MATRIRKRHKTSFQQGLAKAQRPPGSTQYTALLSTWQTPEWVLKPIRTYFGGSIPFDVATAPDNPTQADGFWTEEDNALPRRWPPQCFCNPPYGKAMPKWYRKFKREGARGTELVILIPGSRWEQKYYGDAFVSAEHVCLVRGRINFVMPETGEEHNGNPYSSLLIGWNTDEQRWLEAFERMGACFAIRKLCDAPIKTLRPPKKKRTPRKNLWGETA